MMRRRPTARPRFSLALKFFLVLSLFNWNAGLTSAKPQPPEQYVHSRMTWQGTMSPMKYAFAMACALVLILSICTMVKYWSASSGKPCSKTTYYRHRRKATRNAAQRPPGAAASPPQYDDHGPGTTDQEAAADLSDENDDADRPKDDDVFGTEERSVLKGRKRKHDPQREACSESNSDGDQGDDRDDDTVASGDLSGDDSTNTNVNSPLDAMPDPHFDDSEAPSSSDEMQGDNSHVLDDGDDNISAMSRNLEGTTGS
jgi:hypothetical protein